MNLAFAAVLFSFIIKGYDTAVFILVKPERRQLPKPKGKPGLLSTEVLMYRRINTGPDLRGDTGGPGPRPPPTEGVPPNPSYFFWFNRHLVAYIRLIHC